MTLAEVLGRDSENLVFAATADVGHRDSERAGASCQEQHGTVDHWSSLGHRPSAPPGRPVSADGPTGLLLEASHMRMSYPIHRMTWPDTYARGEGLCRTSPRRGAKGVQSTYLGGAVGGKVRINPREPHSATQGRAPCSCKSPCKARLWSSAELMGLGSGARRAPF